MAQTPYITKARTKVAKAAVGTEFTDVWAGIGTNIGAAEAYADRKFPLGRLRPSVDGVAVGSGILGARVLSANVVQTGRQAECELHVRYLELSPWQSAPTTLASQPTGGVPSNVVLSDPILNVGMVGDILVVGQNAYTIISFASETGCGVSTDATGEASGAACYVRSVTTGDLVEIAGSREIAPGSTTKTYVGRFVSLSEHEDTYTAAGTACPFCLESDVAEAVQTMPAAITRNLVPGLHLYTIQYTGLTGSYASNILTLTRGPMVMLDAFREQYTDLIVVSNTSHFPAIGALYSSDSDADPTARRLVRLDREDDYLPGRYFARATYLGLTGDYQLVGTLDGDPPNAAPCTFDVSGISCGSQHVGQTITISATDGYAITSVTDTNTITVAENIYDAGYRSGDAITISNSSYAFIRGQKTVDTKAKNHWAIKVSYAILAENYAAFKSLYFGSRHGDYTGDFAPHCLRIARDHLGWGITTDSASSYSDVYKVDAFYWTILRPGYSRAWASGSLATERIRVDLTGGDELEEDDDGGAGEQYIRRVTQGDKSKGVPRLRYVVETSHSSGHEAAVDAAAALLGKVNSDNLSSDLPKAVAGACRYDGFTMKYAGPWGSHVLILQHVVSLHPVGWNTYTKSNRFVKKPDGKGGIATVYVSGHEQTHDKYATTAFASVLITANMKWVA